MDDQLKNLELKCTCGMCPSNLSDIAYAYHEASPNKWYGRSMLCFVHSERGNEGMVYVPVKTAVQQLKIFKIQLDALKQENEGLRNLIVNLNEALDDAPLSKNCDICNEKLFCYLKHDAQLCPDFKPIKEDKKSINKNCPDSQRITTDTTDINSSPLMKPMMGGMVKVAEGVVAGASLGDFLKNLGINIEPPKQDPKNNKGGKQ